jgi:KDO2-lipid IV(A) lauroyltransferase
MEEVPPPPEQDREAAALALTATLSRHIEAAIRRTPEQWVWMHQRWKTRPEAEPSTLSTGVGAPAPAR